MYRAPFLIALAWLPPLAGCATHDSTTLVSTNPFNAPAAVAGARTQVSFAPASTEIAARVDTLGRKLLAANPQIGLRPLFRTIGAPQPEIFHSGTSEVDVTEGLVKGCKSDGELAAALCMELGKMVSEREAQAGPQARLPSREPPEDVRVGSDNAGTFGPADQTHLAELAKFEKQYRKPTAPVMPPPDPQMLARDYFTKAGFPVTDLDGAAPLLKAAAANSNLEKQLTPNLSRDWSGTNRSTQ